MNLQAALFTTITYTHLWPGDEDRTRSVMDATLGVLRTECGPDESADGSAAGQGLR